MPKWRESKVTRLEFDSVLCKLPNNHTEFKSMPSMSRNFTGTPQRYVIDRASSVKSGKILNDARFPTGNFPVETETVKIVHQENLYSHRWMTRKAIHFYTTGKVKATI